MWVGCRENSQKAAAGRVGVRQHLQEHLVASGDQGPGLERATEAAEPLPVDVTAVNVHVVVAAQVVALQVNKAERQDHHLSLGDLGGSRVVVFRIEAITDHTWLVIFMRFITNVLSHVLSLRTYCTLAILGFMHQILHPNKLGCLTLLQSQQKKVPSVGCGWLF